MDLSEKNLYAIQSVTGKRIEDAGHVLQGFRPGIVVGPDVEPGTLAFTAAKLLVGLLARLYPLVALVGPPAASDRLLDEATRINPAFAQSAVADFWLALGAVPTIPANAAGIYLGAYGWHAVVSTEPVGFELESSVFAGMTAACLGAWETFRYAAGRVGFARRWVPTTYAWNLLTHDIGPVSTLEGIPAIGHGPIKLPNTVLVGAGALGHGFTYALRETGCLTGRVTLVDNRPVKDDTRQRYACQYHGDHGSKVDILGAQLASSFLEVIRAKKDFLTYVNEDAPDCDIDVVVAAVDREEARVRIQATLPQVIINGWTGQGTMGLSVHRFINDSACLACLYSPTQTGTVSEEVLIFEGLRRAIPLPRIRWMLMTNQPLSIVDTQALIEHGFPTNPIGKFLGKSIQSAYQGLICSGLIVQLPGQAPKDVPLAFMSAMIGVLQALELVKLSVPALAPYSLDGRLQFHVLRRPDCIHAPLAKRSDCICRDQAYVRAYRDKWGLPQYGPERP